MYELLLQADKALADGMLDQAERTYWQLIELDPSNAIAVAGLARVSLERGDERLARRLADRAMSIDPESVAARRIVDSLEHKGVEQPEADLPDLPMMAAERLEALGRRRSGAKREKAEDEDSPADSGADGSKASLDRAPQAATTPPARHRHAI
ncbi:MAG: tetratricopeptide repeat protein, partial [Candidatus Limnocylindrales bacterium]